MDRAKNFWRLIQAVACFGAAVAKGLLGDAAWALGALRKIPDLAKRAPDSAPGFFRALRCAARALFDFLTGEKSVKFIKKIQRDFEQGVRRSRRGEGEMPLFSTRGRRVAGSENRWRMFKRQYFGAAFLAFCAGFIGGGSALIYFLDSSRPILIGFGLPAGIFFAAWLVATISGHQIRCFHLGLLGERKMAQNLERLISRPDWFVFHGVNTRYGGDIDHVLVCPKGVFCFEVKALSPKSEGEKILYYRIEPDETRGKICQAVKDGKRVSLAYPDPLRQAAHNAVLLHDRLREEIGESPGFVKRIVYFPEWKVEREGEHRERDEFVSGDPAEIVRFLNSFPPERDEMLSAEENQEKIRKRIGKIREFLDRESGEEWTEIPL